MKAIVTTTINLLAGIMMSAFRRVLSTWEACQVELHGRYSSDQLCELARYEREVHPLRALVVVALTPLLCIVVLLVLDLMPLKSAYLGLEAQGPWYWIRLIIFINLVACIGLTQFSHASPTLSLTPRTIGFISLVVISPGAAVAFYAMHVVIGFPTPFSFSLEVLPFNTILFGVLRMLWASSLRGSIEVRRDVIRFGTFWLSQVCMLIIYPTMTFVFRTLSGDYQTLFALALPVVKMAIKNWAAYGAHRVEHITPVCVAFSVDVFHSLFVSCAMQSGTSLGTLGVVMAVDIFQCVVAFAEVQPILQRLQRLRTLLDTPQDVHDHTGPQPSRGNVNSPSSELHQAVLILSTDDKIRNHPRVKLPRHSRKLLRRETLRTESMNLTTTAHRIQMLKSAESTRVPMGSQTRKVYVVNDENEEAKVEQARQCYVLETMQLFYMVEFYLLIELTEVFVAVIYAIYLGAMFYLPNRYNYSHLKGLSDEQYISTLLYLLKYGAYELLSLLVLAFVFRTKLRVSPLHQLSFTLERNWRLAQALLVFGISFPVELSLDHTGNDYTMKFAWLRANNTIH